MLSVLLALAPSIMGIRIRKEAPSDVEAIEAVIVTAFLNAAHTDHTEQFIVNALRNSGQLSVSLVADDNGAVIGHVAVSPVTVSNGAAGWYGLGCNGQLKPGRSTGSVTIVERSTTTPG